MDTFPIPRIDDCIDKIGQSKFVFKFDLLKGFWQIPLTEKAKKNFSFRHSRWSLQYKIMPFGMKNSLLRFNKVISRLDGVGAYIDDIIIYSNILEEHLHLIRSFFDRLSEFQLTINLNKSEICHRTLTFLGHVVGQGQVKPISAKVKAINDFPVPSSKKNLMRFLGMTGYYRKLCNNFSSMSALIDLLKTKCKFVWNETCQNSFENIKAMLSNAPVLLAPNFCKPFKLVDCSYVGAG